LRPEQLIWEITDSFVGFWHPSLIKGAARTSADNLPARNNTDNSIVDFSQYWS
jgi:hypothetical protein